MTFEIRSISVCSHFVPLIAGWHFEEWGQHDPGGTLESWTEGLASRTHAGRIPTTLVAFDADTPIGSACLVEHDMETRRDLTPWLAGVFVIPSHRGRGVASLLVARAASEARRFGVSQLFLYTNGAEDLYSRLGWRPVCREFYEERSVSVMSLTLGT